MQGRSRRHAPCPSAPTWGLACIALVATTLLAGCSREEDIRAVIDETEAFCAANPVPDFPASVTASSVYVGAGALTRSWHHWIPARLLQHGFTEVESAASIAPYIEGRGQYLRFRIADAGDAGCAGQRAFAAHLGPAEWQTTQRRLVDQGLRPGQCLAIERTPRRTSPYWIEAWDAAASLSDLHEGLPLERKRIRFVLTEARSRRVLHEHFAEYGIVNASFAVPFGCMRRQEWDRFSDQLVLGSGGSGAANRSDASGDSTPAVPTGPTMIEQPPAVAVETAELEMESSRDLGGVKIDGLELSKRRERSSRTRIDGFEILEGEGREQGDYNVTNPGWPRYLQLVADGEYRRVRLAWLEGEPHGMHDRPVRMYDLGDRIGVFAVTRRMSPETRGAVDLSWAEMARDTGLPVRRIDGVMPIDPDSDVVFHSLIEDVQASEDGLRFTLTEVGVRRGSGDGSGWVLLRESKYRWRFE
jgi:hypothetical protein